MSESKNKKIEIFEDGQRVFSGDDRRGMTMYPLKTYYGLTVRDIVFIVSGIIWLVVFSMKTDRRIIVMEDAMLQLNKHAAYAAKFFENSDSFHGQVMDTTFEQGRPNTTYNRRTMIRELIHDAEIENRRIEREEKSG